MGAINYKAQKALGRLAAMPGMEQVKDQVEQMVQLAHVAKLRQQHNLKTQPQSQHMLFMGNPGTGKTTAARLIGEAFAAIGLLKSDGDQIPFVEVYHSDVAHAHVGQSERNMASKFEKARGGVMFIDEAYAFLGKSEHRTDEKVIATIVQYMEDMRDEVVVIAAGYADKMGAFLKSNPGLSSRFSTTIHFPDYSVGDLMRIGKQMLVEQDFQATPDYLEALESVLWIEKSRPSFGNGRTVRNHVERSIRRQAVRVSKQSQIRRDDLFLLKGEDLIHDPKTLKLTEKEVLRRVVAEAQQRLAAIEKKEFLFGV